MRVLVTGHLGYIGTVLIPMLLSDGHDAVGLDTDYFSQCTFGDGISEIPTIKKDIRDVKVSDLKEFDAVLHLAGLSNDPLSDLDPKVTFDVNYNATIKLAEAAKKAGVSRFIFSSSCSNYGIAGEDLLTEESKLNPTTPYGRSKVLAEEGLKKLADKDFSPVFLRSATAYGFSPRLRFDLVLNNLVAWAHTTGRVFLKSNGSPWRPLIHVEDISLAFVSVLSAPKDKVHNQAFNVGITEENYQIKDLAEIVKQTVPGSEVEYSNSPIQDKRCYRVDCSKIKSMIGFKPKWDVRRGSKQMLDAYKKIGLKLEDFEGLRFKRIDHIKSLLSSGQLDSNLRWRT